jgi:hypothetical protein
MRARNLLAMVSVSIVLKTNTGRILKDMVLDDEAK